MNEIIIVSTPNAYELGKWSVYIFIPALGNQILNGFRLNDSFLGEPLHMSWGFSTKEGLHRYSFAFQEVSEDTPESAVEKARQLVEELYGRS